MIPMPRPGRSPFLPFPLFAAALLLGQALAQGTAPTRALPDDRAPGAAAVSEAECRQWLGTLAGPEFEGRGTGQPGFQKAADYVAAHFRALGLEARGENGGYFQTVPWETTTVDAANSHVAFAKDGKEVLKLPADRLAGTVSSAIDQRGGVVLLVVEAPAAPAQPPAEGRRGRFEVPVIPGLDQVDVQGKVVIAYLKPSSDRRAGTMLRFAVQQGLSGKQPAALLFAQDEVATGGLRGRPGAGRRTNPALAGSRRAPLDVAIADVADLKALLQAAGQDPAVLAGQQLAHPLAVEGHVVIAVKDEQAPAMNVWAVLPGSDPAKRGEYVVIGSHLDHLGRRGDTIHPGADDDGSGTTGVLAVAQMFAKNKVKPARSILFVCFCGEENGLIGSDYFAKNCPVPLSSIVAELQMDMIGRDEEENVEGNRGEKAEDNRNTVHLVGTQKLAPALHELCLATNGTAGFELEYDQEGMFGRSDHANFAKMGVPIAFFFTGLHRDYHQPTDTPDRIHYAKLLRIARWVYDLGFELASQPGRPEVEPELWQKYRGKGSEQPAAPLRAGAGK